MTLVYSSYTQSLLDNADFLALKHGTGFFETLLYNGEQICHLEAHLRRLFRSLRHFNIDFEDADFGWIINQLIAEGGFAHQPAKVNIYYPVVAIDKPAKPIVAVEPYAMEESAAVRLCVYPGQHDSFMSQHKSMSYFPYVIAKQYARQRGFDDAIMIDSQSIFAETATAAFIFKLEDQWCMSGVKNKLNSVSLSIAEELFGPMAILYIDEKDFQSIDYLYTINSLSGMRPVSYIGDAEIPVDWDGCDEVNARVLCRERVYA